MDDLGFNYHPPSSTREILTVETIFRSLLVLCVGIFVFTGIARAQDGPLKLSATATPDPVRPGGQVTYTFTITNQGESDASGVQLQTTVPGYVEDFSGDSTNASGYFCGDGSDLAVCSPGSEMRWNLGTLPAGQSRSATFAVSVKSDEDGPPEGTEISSSGTVSANNVGGGSASVGVTAKSEPAFSLEMTGNRSPIAPGQELTYTLNYGNPTQSAHSGVVLRASIPSGASFMSAGGGGIVDETTVRWTIGKVEAGEIGRRTFTVKADPNLSNGAVLSTLARIDNRKGEKARAGMATAVQSDAPLILKTSARPNPTQGQTEFTLTATNQSNTELTGLQLQTTVPGYVEAFSGDSTDASGYFCRDGGSLANCFPGDEMRWNLGTLPAGQSRSATFAVNLKPGEDGPPVNTVLSTGATVTADGVGGGAGTASVLASTSSYSIDETVSGRFQTSTSVEDSTFAATVQLKADPGETDLGTSTVRVSYNHLALKYNSVSFANYDGKQLSFTGGTVTYNSTVKQPNPGVLALKIAKESSTDGNGQALTNEWTDVATLTFDITAPFSTSKLGWPRQDIYNRLGAPDGEYKGGTFTPSDQPLPVELVVWPGDANNDGEVDQTDVLPLGQNWDATGPARERETCEWRRATVHPWSAKKATYADANGDGEANQADVLCIGQNWGKTHSTSNAAALAAKEQKPKGTVSLRRTEVSGLTAWYELRVEDTGPLVGVSAELTFPHGHASVMEVQPGPAIGSDALFESKVSEKNGRVAIGASRKGDAVPEGGVFARVKIRTEEGQTGGMSMAVREATAGLASGQLIPLEVTTTEAAVSRLSLKTPLPNPVRVKARVEYALPETKEVRLSLYNTLGQEVKVLASGRRQAGHHSAVIEASKLSSGLYLLRLEAGRATKTRKVTVVR